MPCLSVPNHKTSRCQDVEWRVSFQAGQVPVASAVKDSKFTGVEGHHLAVLSRGFQDSSTNEPGSRANPGGPLTVASGLPGMMDPKMAEVPWASMRRGDLRYVT